MKTFKVEIEGVSPLLIHRFQESSEQPEKMKISGKRDFGTPREQAEKCCYVDVGSNQLWVPSTWIKGAMASISSDYKLPSSRKSVKSVIGGAVLVGEEKIYFSPRKTISDIEVDSRPCVVQRARIMRHRARLESWKISFVLEIENDILDSENVHKILSDAGRRSGIGDFRPQKGGPFGRYIVTKWEAIN